MALHAVLIYADDSAHRPNHTAEDTESCDRHAEELTPTGAMVAAWAFTPRSRAASVRGDRVSAAPYHGDRQLVVGIYLIEAEDLDAAVAIARRNPACREGGGVEVRPVAEGGVIDPAAVRAERRLGA
ncbi:MAG TPA: YciI family protein [Microlunatus sp.]|nr:YciI family protein [Microlunatus sp.]